MYFPNHPQLFLQKMNENKENNEKKHKIKQIKGKAQIVFKIKLKTLAPYHETFRRHDRKLFK